jgi:two-component system sensor histidine kinase/response regulator
MDGFEATARIRADARFRSLPIIAMTAHATLEERQRCLDAGMSDHVGKPIDPRTLIDTIRRHYLAPSSLPGRASAPNAADVTPLPVIDGLDSAAGLGRVGGNRALYLRLLRQFADEERSAMSRIAGAEGRHDRATAERAAHTLKGVAANIGATAVAGAAAALEKAFRSDGPAEAIASARQQLAARLEPLLASLTVALEASSPPPGPDEGVPAPLEAGVAERLLSLLADSDPEAADLAEAHAPALKAALGAAWPSFEQQVRRYAFDDAHRLLSRALTASPSGDSEDRRPSGAKA